MILWLDLFGAVLILASVTIWMVVRARAARAASREIDHYSLPDDQLGL